MPNVPAASDVFVCCSAIVLGLTLDNQGWQARRDSNPQPSDLESAALPIRATRLKLSGLSMHGVLAAGGAELLELDSLLLPNLLGLRGSVVARAAEFTLKRDPDARTHRYSMILEITPAPTVRPPSRIAKRIWSSRATGVMSSISMVTLSPGMTILTSSGS